MLLLLACTRDVPTLGPSHHGQVTGDQGYRTQAERALERYGPQIARVARVMPFMMSNLALAHAHPQEITIVGDRTDPRTQALEREVASRYLPFAVVLTVQPGQPTARRCRQCHLRVRWPRFVHHAQE